MDARTQEYLELRQQEIDYWHKAAERKRADGQHATAISYDNMAWLLEHQESWLAHTARSSPN